MEAKEYRTIDKSTWGPGAWQDEPDKAQWQDPATGLPSLIVRSVTGGNLCGYVGITEAHPLFGKDYSDMDEDFDVHGGLTFSAACSPHESEETGICHVPGPGESDHVWWFGFDCGHAFDVMPAMVAHLRRLGHELPPFCLRDEVYRDLAYVKAQVAGLALQLAVAGDLHPALRAFDALKGGS
jgi:hypothetical protein